MKVDEKKIKRLFWKLGTCAQTLFYILNREFDSPMEEEERAIDPLAGGILQQGYQCGMLWGSAMAAGAESFRRSSDPGKAFPLAIKTTQRLMESFINRTNSHDCSDITNCNFNSKISMAMYMITGKFLSCLKLAEKWAPEAIDAAVGVLSDEQNGQAGQPVNCASEVLKRMGADDLQQCMVAGFAGGMGLSGNACGALGAAIWMKSIAWSRKNAKKSPFKNPDAQNTLKLFYEASGYEILCHKIAGKRFESVEDHADYIKNGGCKAVLDVLAQQ